MATKIELDNPFVKCNKAKDSCTEVCPHAGNHKSNDDCDRIVCSRINEYTECVPVEVDSGGKHELDGRVWEEFPE